MSAPPSRLASPHAAARGPERGRREARASAWCWAALGLAVAGWEIFLRLDSQVLGLGTKLWLFALLALGLPSGAAIVGAALAGAASARARPEPATRLRHLAFPTVAAATAALEYALLVFHHAPDRLGVWPLVALAGAGVGALVVRLSERVVARGGAGRDRTPPRALLALAALLAAGGLASALTRPEIAPALLRRNSALGRVLGHGLAHFPPRHTPPPATPQAPPDLVAGHPLARGSILLLTVDTLRADALSCYGAAPQASPELDALARRAIVFDDAYAQAPLSAPSMATALTGLYPLRHGVRRNRMALADAMTTLPEILGRSGWATAAFVTNPFFARAFGFDQGFAAYRDLATASAPGETLGDSSDPEAVDGALAWARAHADGPFFLWVHLMAPHAPYVPPADLQPRLDPGRGPWFNVWNMPPASARVEGGHTYFDRDVYARLYAAEVRSADRLAGRLVHELESARLLDGAHVIVVADHGEAFGERDAFAHGRTLDRVETRVPWLWRLPGNLRAGTRIATTIQLADLVPTLLRLVDVPAPAVRDGRDLSGLVLGEAPEDPGRAFTETRFWPTMGVRGRLYGLRTRARSLWLDTGYPYTCAFDRTVDPAEQACASYRPRTPDPLYEAVVSLALASEAALASAPPAPPPSRDEQERLRALGYVQ